MDNNETTFGQVISELNNALSLLGADSFLLAAVGSWRDTLDDEAALRQITTWVDKEIELRHECEDEIEQRRAYKAPNKT